MDDALRFFRTFEPWIYVLLVSGAFIYLRRFIRAWDDLRSSLFGLERENAQSRLNQAASVLVLLFIIGVSEFVLVTFVAPLRPGSMPLMTPTLDLQGNATLPAVPEAASLEGEIPGLGSATPLPTVDLATSSCIPGQIEITFPKSGAQVSGEISIEGTADIPDFGFYKVEVARQEESLWQTIQAGRKVVDQASLVELWDTTIFRPGDHVLRLVVMDNQGQALPDCRIPIRIAAP